MLLASFEVQFYERFAAFATGAALTGRSAIATVSRPSCAHLTMPTTQPATAPARQFAPHIWGQMPARMKVLYVTTLHRTGGWLAEAFASDCATDILFSEAVGVTAALTRLRDEVFDAVLVSHDPGILDALDLVEGLRAGGNEEPMIILGNVPSSELTALAYEVGADAYCCIAETTTRSLLWTFARAIERCQLVREHRRLVQTEQQRLAHEHHEAERLLAEQRALIADLELLQDGRVGEGDMGRGRDIGDDAPQESPPLPLSLSPSLDSSVPDLPPRLISHYRELLRAYVVMGAGNLADELTTLATLLADAGVSAQCTMQLHVHVLEELIGSLGNRSARHVMNRADLLVLEVMAHLADSYRQRYHDENHASQH
jgi:hypothetical protein